jgi:hypothetical protein
VSVPENQKEKSFKQLELLQTYLQMYCTLQEAYNVPSFDPPGRKKRCSPDVQLKTSADAYEPYRRDGGNGTGDFTMYRYATPKSVQDEPIQGNKPLQRRIPYETFTNRANEDDTVTRPPYKAMEADRRQNCISYGTCSADQMETFISGAPVDQQQRITNMKTANRTPGKTSGDVDQCMAGSDFYEMPLSEETKKQFQKAMNTSLEQKTTSTRIPEPKMRYDDMKNVTGYYDDDLEQYLKNSEANNIPKRFPMNPEAKPTDGLYDPKTSPLQQTIKRFSEHSIQQPLAPERLAGSNNYERKVYPMPGTGAGSYGWDLALFILAGILIIFLIDQLFKMGVMLGMRHTMELMDPFMKDFREILKNKG